MCNSMDPFQIEMWKRACATGSVATIQEIDLGEIFNENKFVLMPKTLKRISV